VLDSHEAGGYLSCPSTSGRSPSSTGGIWAGRTRGRSDLHPRARGLHRCGRGIPRPDRGPAP